MSLEMERLLLRLTCLEVNWTMERCFAGGETTLVLRMSLVSFLWYLLDHRIPWGTVRSSIKPKTPFVLTVMKVMMEASRSILSWKSEIPTFNVFGQMLPPPGHRSLPEVFHPEVLLWPSFTLQTRKVEVKESSFPFQLFRYQNLWTEWLEVSCSLLWWRLSLQSLYLMTRDFRAILACPLRLPNDKRGSCFVLSCFPPFIWISLAPSIVVHVKALIVV